MCIENHDIVDNLSVNERKDEGYLPLDVRIFNWVSLVGVCVVCAVGILNVVVSGAVIEMFYAIVAILVGCLSGYSSTRHGQGQHLCAPSVLFFLILLIEVWLTNQGYVGSTPCWLFFALSCCNNHFFSNLSLASFCVCFVCYPRFVHRDQ